MVNPTVVRYTYHPYLSQGNTDQDVLLGQRAGDTGGQQVRHGTRTCDIVRAGQNAGRRAEHRILRNVRQRQPQCQGRYTHTIVYYYNIIMIYLRMMHCQIGARYIE